MLLSTGQRVYFSNHEPLPVEDVAESLLALKAIIERVPAVLTVLFPSISIQDVSVYLSEIKTGSLLEDLVVRLVWGNQGNLEAGVDRARDALRIEKLLQNKTL